MLFRSPSNPAVIHAQGLAAEANEDIAGARKYYEQALQLTPGDVEVLGSLGGLATQERKWAEAMGYLRRTQTLDPRNPIVLWGAYNALLTLRQYDQAMQNARLLVELQPDSLDAAFALASVPFFSRGSRQEMETLLARLTPQQQQDPKVIAAKFNWYYHAIGDARAYVELSDRQGTDINFSDADSTMQYAEALCVLGQRDRAATLARPVLDQLNAKLAASPDDYRLLSSVAYAQALVGDRDATLATLDHMLAQVDRQPLRMENYIRANAGIVYGWIGEKDKAMDLLVPQLKVPSAATSSVHALRHDIDFSPLRGFPRWEAALADPAHSRPFKY